MTTVAQAKGRARVRHTPLMRALQYEYRMTIDRLILNELIKSQGEFRAVARKLKVSQATLSRWVVELHLIDEASKIRESFGQASTATTLNLEPASKGAVINIKGDISGSCTACEIEFDNVMSPEFIGVSEAVETDSHTMIIRDENNDRHWFPLTEIEEDKS